MATINFPSSPVLNDQYSFEGKTWTFNGDGWVLTSTPTTLRIDAAFDAANTANVNANLALQLAITSNQRSACNEISIDFLENAIDIVSAFGVSTSNTANAAYLHANAAFDTANLADPVFIQYTADLANSAANTANTANAEVFLARFYACSAIQQITFAEANTFGHSNSAYRHANASFDQANTATILAQASFDYANTLSGGTSEDGWARDVANSAASYANGAFVAANTSDQKAVTSGSYANSAYIHANSAYQEANLNYSNVLIATELAGDAYDAANSASLYANAAFIEANTANTLAQAAFNAANNATDSWVRDAANSASSYANSAFTAANTADQRAVTSGDYANSAYSAANAAYALAQSGGTPLSGEFDYGLITDVNNTIQDYGTL